MIKLKKKSIKKTKKQPELTCQTCNSGYKTKKTP